MRKFSALPGVFAGFAMLFAPALSSAGISFSIGIAPPVLRIYEQPPCPTDGFLWTPGYWGYRDTAYYWIPGAWVRPPQAGFLWTPGYWGYSNGFYGFNAGYWGTTVGFYGGVNYGFGYGGSGFDGGRWQGGHFAYNTAVSRVNTTVIHNTYNQKVVNRGSNRTSFNGGPGGISTRPSAAETSTAREHNQPSSAPVAQQRASATGTSHSAAPVAREQARPATTESRPAANTRPVAQPKQVASNRTPATSSHPAPQARAPQARPETHAAAPEHAAAPRPEARPAARPEARPEAREERK